MKARHWKKLDSTEVLNHPRIQLIEDTVELPDGKTTTYIRHAPAKVHSVAIIAINDKQEMLIQKEYSYPPNQVMWQLPGGGTREDEDIITAANRELSEESGYIGTICREIGSFYIDNRRSDMKQYVVLCTNLQPQTGQRDEEEFIETHWVPIARLRSMIASGEFDNAYLLAGLSIYFSQAD
ncbi:MAG TPA: NUDIX hydrolase [Candidatus Saccharimonadales bacterium]|nr:NUDIX hydrolase [Candidatus Saccharimonadales bacterium]